MNTHYAAVSIQQTAFTQKLLSQAFLLIAVCFAITVLMASAAYANATTNFGAKTGGFLCSIAVMIQGQMGKGIATLAIIFLGIGAALGKISWGQALIVCVGIAVIFGAGELASVFSNTKCTGIDNFSPS